jgi:hypothetical protein
LAHNVGVNLIGEFVEDASSFKVVPKARDPRTFPKLRDIETHSPRRNGKKARKKKGK